VHTWHVHLCWRRRLHFPLHLGTVFWQFCRKQENSLSSTFVESTRNYAPFASGGPDGQLTHHVHSDLSTNHLAGQSHLPLRQSCRSKHSMSRSRCPNLLDLIIYFCYSVSANVAQFTPYSQCKQYPTFTTASSNSSTTSLSFVSIRCTYGSWPTSVRHIRQVDLLHLSLRPAQRRRISWCTFAPQSHPSISNLCSKPTIASR